MIGNRLLSAWDGLVASTALIAIIVLALGIMVRAVKLGDLSRRLGAVLGALILLLLLPTIIVSLWNSMSFLQRLGAIALCVAVVLFFGISSRPPKGDTQQVSQERICADSSRRWFATIRHGEKSGSLMSYGSS